MNKPPCTISEVAKSYSLVPQTVRMLGEQMEKTHSGTKGEEMTAAQLADYKKIKAELREARLEIDFRDKTAAFFSDGSPSQEHDTLAPPRRGQLPDPFDVPLSGGVTFRLLRLAQQGYVGNPQSAVKNSPFL